MDDIIQEFLAESWENLTQLDAEVVGLENEPRNSDRIAGIFRTIHTIKGTCGFVGLSELGAVAHSAENVLGQMRSGALGISSSTISLVLEAVDEIKRLLRRLEMGDHEHDRADRELIGRLDALAAATNDRTAAAKRQTVAVPAPIAKPVPIAYRPRADAVVQALETPVVSVAPATLISAQPAILPQPIKVGDPSEVASLSAASLEPAAPAAAGDNQEKSVADLSIRVNVDVLDGLMNLVGELVLTRNQLLQLASRDEQSTYSAAIAQLNRVTTGLQEGVLKTRMQPIGSAWSKFPRLVRDLARVTGKRIELEMSGAETELDRTILDAIKDPLTHMVRNSADHGIETPAVRRQHGKPETGHIRLNAVHEGGHMIVRVEDDGRGIDLDRVRAQAVRQGLIAEEAARALSEHDVLQFVFRPGLSTAEKVGAVSGRGVGMDVVKTQIEKIGGTIELSSQPGRGTSVRIKIPLTLAIVPALVVAVGSESFAIPQLEVVELVRLPADERHKIERIRETEVLSLRNRLLPLVRLGRLLDVAEPEGKDIHVVVVQVGEEKYGFIVSEVFDTQEIVVKPVGTLLRDLPFYQGTTILGDGRVILILDVAGIVSPYCAASCKYPQYDAVDGEAADGEDGGLGTTETTRLLLFDAGPSRRMAVPLSLVSRLEEIPRDCIEGTGDFLVAQYRDSLLPLLPVEGHEAGAFSDPQSVIVVTEGPCSFGLMIERVQDIVEERLIIRTRSRQPGILGTAIIDGRTREVLDTRHYMIRANPDWFGDAVTRTPRRILIVDDSPFFRQLAKTSLESEGFSVITADGARQALELIDRGAVFDVCAADLDMPDVDGFELARCLRCRRDTAGRPIIALMAAADPRQENLALQAGFDRVYVKFDARQIATAIYDLTLENDTHAGVSA